MKKSMVLAFFGTILFITTGTFLSAQDQGGPGGPGRFGGPGGMGNFDPAQLIARIQETQLANMQVQLKATDEEWTVLKPLVAVVLKSQIDSVLNGGLAAFMGGMGRGGMRGGGMNIPGLSELQLPEMVALQTVVEKEGAAADEIKAKLAAYRAAKKKQEAALKAAQEKLRTMLTLRQEAVLVVNGMLD